MQGFISKKKNQHLELDLKAYGNQCSLCNEVLHGHTEACL